MAAVNDLNVTNHERIQNNKSTPKLPETVVQNHRFGVGFALALWTIDYDHAS